MGCVSSNEDLHGDDISILCGFIKGLIHRLFTQQGIFRAPILEGEMYVVHVHANARVSINRTNRDIP